VSSAVIRLSLSRDAGLCPDLSVSGLVRLPGYLPGKKRCKLIIWITAKVDALVRIITINGT